MRTIQFSINHDYKTDYGAVLLFIACLAWPFYIFDSGKPQLFAYLLVAYCVCVLYSRFDISKIIIETRLISIAFVIFLAYSFIVNGYHAISAGKLKPVLYSLYFALSFGVATVFFLHIRENPIIPKILYYGIAISLLVQGVLVVFYLDDDCFKREMFFYGPNQLAFYALISLAILSTLFPHVKRRLWLFSAAATMSLVLILITNSRAAFAAAILLLLIQIVTGPRQVKQGIAITVVCLSILVLVFQAVGSRAPDCPEGQRMLSSSVGELSTISRLSSSTRNIVGRLKIRGYDRIWKYPEYLVFGAGEGLVRDYSFNGSKNIELHSSIGTLIFSYGIPGAIFFLYLAALAIRRGGTKAVLLILPIVVYALFHNTLRQPFFWMYLVLLLNPNTYRMLSDRPGYSESRS